MTILKRFRQLLEQASSISRRIHGETAKEVAIQEIRDNSDRKKSVRVAAMNSPGFYKRTIALWNMM